jgi:hypothetical protein
MCQWSSIIWAAWSTIIGTSHPGFQALLRGVGEGRLWSKLSGTYRLGATPPDYAEARPFHDALVAANPQNPASAPRGAGAIPVLEDWNRIASKFKRPVPRHPLVKP